MNNIVLLISGQTFKVQQDLSVKTEKLLLIPFSPDGGTNFTTRECPCYGHYADGYWFDFNKIKENSGEHFACWKGQKYKIINYDDVNYNSLDNPVNALDKVYVKLQPESFIRQFYAIVLDYGNDVIRAISWDCLGKIIHIKEKKEDMNEVLRQVFIEHQHCYTKSADINLLNENKTNVNFLNLKIKCPRTIESNGYKYFLKFQLENAEFEYKDLLS